MHTAPTCKAYEWESVRDIVKELNPYDLLNEFATAEEIKVRLLKEPKERLKKDVHVSGTKAHLIQQVKQLVAKKELKFDEVMNLIREGEENGDQHIFYFKAVGNAKAYLRSGSFPEDLWGEDWGSMNFPKIEVNTERLDWSDYRRSLDGKPKDWIAKLYGEEVHETPYKKDTKGKYIRHWFATEQVRMVCLLRWNDPDLLEVRISRTGSTGKKTMMERLAKIWELVGGVITPNMVTAWDLRPIHRRMIADRETHKTLFRPGSVALRDSKSGKAEFKPYTEDDELDDSAECSAAIDTILNESRTGCDAAAIRWLPQEKVTVFEEPFVTYQTGVFPNELVIRKKAVGSAAIDYVTNQLRRFGEA
jgi:hypothetical protein